MYYWMNDANNEISVIVYSHWCNSKSVWSLELSLNGKELQKMSLIFFSLCSVKKKNTVYSLGVIAGWINNDNEINFGWIIPVKACISIMTAGMLPFFAAYLIHINVWRKRLILAGGELGKREKKKPNTIVSFEN